MIKESREAVVTAQSLRCEVREKISAYGTKTCTNTELMMEIIGYNKFSKLQAFKGTKGLRYILEADHSILREYGFSDIQATKILAVTELAKRMISLDVKEKNKICSPQDVCQLFMENMRYLKKEYFNVILLNTKNRIIDVVNISIGNLNSSIVHPREVFIEAIKRSCASMILVHNHPSGDSKPSKEDINITKRLVEGGKIIGIGILDHIIIGDGKYVSFREQGLI